MQVQRKMKYGRRGKGGTFFMTVDIVAVSKAVI
jgi:hypothetical protein